jgi:hypothetical protein
LFISSPARYGHWRSSAFSGISLPERWQNVGMAFAGTFVICILTALTFFWLMIWAGVAIVPLLALNLSGAAWALAVGTWRWRALQKQAPVVAAGDGTLPQEKRPALLGLRAIEIVGLVVGVFMLIAAILAYLAFFYVTYRFRRHLVGKTCGEQGRIPRGIALRETAVSHTR